MTAGELVTKAREAQKNAYAPYSNFKVGAALLTKCGRLYTGANVENTSYGLTVCAERIAIFKAVTSGENQFTTIAIAGSGKGYIFPCGACLQVLAEFAPDIKIIVSDENDNYKEYCLKEMLPQTFTIR